MAAENEWIKGGNDQSFRHCMQRLKLEMDTLTLTEKVKTVVENSYCLNELLVQAPPFMGLPKENDDGKIRGWRLRL